MYINGAQINLGGREDFDCISGPFETTYMVMNIFNIMSSSACADGIDVWVS